MKKRLLVLLSILLFNFISFGSRFIEPNEGKALVYFSRTSALGFAVNFKFFDGDSYIGKFNGDQYMIYECDPGIHSFWALSGGMTMVYANLEAGRTYFINAVPKMGAFKAQVRLEILDKNNKKFEKKQLRILRNILIKNRKEFTSEELKSAQTDLAEEIARGVRYVNVMNSHDIERPILTSDMFYEIPKEFKK